MAIMASDQSASASNDPERTFLSLFGELSMLFSNLEAAVALILESLVNRDDPLVVGLVARDLPLARKVELIREVAAVRFCNDAKMEKRICDLLGQVNRHRVERNGFIHGMWEVNPSRLSQGRVRCCDFRWRRRKGKKEWYRP